MAEHKIVITDGNEIEISGITEVIGFDSESIVADTPKGRLLVEGSGLSVSDISVSSGEISAKGEIFSLHYSEINEIRSGFFSKLFK